MNFIHYKKRRANLSTLRVFTNLTPFIASPSKERGKRFIERGFTPLLPALPPPLLREGGQGDGLLSNLDFIVEART